MTGDKYFAMIQTGVDRELYLDGWVEQMQKLPETKRERMEHRRTKETAEKIQEMAYNFQAGNLDPSNEMDRQMFYELLEDIKEIRTLQLVRTSNEINTKGAK